MTRMQRRLACAILLALWCLVVQTVVAVLPREGALCATASCPVLAVPTPASCCAADPAPAEPSPCTCDLVPLPGPVAPAAIPVLVTALPLPPAIVLYLLPPPKLGHVLPPARRVPSGPDPSRFRAVVLIC